MPNLQTPNQLTKLPPDWKPETSQDSFNAMMNQLNWAILSWSRIWTDRAGGKVDAYQASRSMLMACFPAEAAEYERQCTESLSNILSPEREVQHA